MRRRRIIWAGILALVGAISLSIYFRRPPAELFHEMKVIRSDLTVSILSTGVVQPENRLEIKPPIAGRVESVLIDEGEHIKKGQILAWMSSTERAVLLDSARAHGAGELKKWESYYQPTPIVAPITGTLIARNVEPGQTFAATDAVFVMSDRLTVKAQVDETDISNIKLKMPATVVLDAYPDNPLDAQVDQIAYDAKTVNSVTTYVVDVLPRETPAFVRSGMTANVTFNIDTKKDVLLIPAEAVKRKEGRVFVLTPGGRLPIEKDIQVGSSDGKRTEVLSGLNEGDTVLAQIPKKAGTLSTSPFTPQGPRKR